MIVTEAKQRGSVTESETVLLRYVEAFSFFTSIKLCPQQFPEKRR
jgi:hypothetical protein